MHVDAHSVEGMGKRKVIREQPLHMLSKSEKGADVFSLQFFTLQFTQLWIVENPRLVGV